MCLLSLKVTVSMPLDTGLHHRPRQTHVLRCAVGGLASFDTIIAPAVKHLPLKGTEPERTPTVEEGSMKMLFSSLLVSSSKCYESF